LHTGCQINAKGRPEFCLSERRKFPKMLDMESTPHVSVQQTDFFDMDEQAAQLHGYDQLYRQLTCGRFAGRFTTLTASDNCGLHLEQSNQVVEQSASVPPDQVALIFLLGGVQPTRFGRQTFDQGQYILAGPGSEIDFCNGLDTTICVLAVPAKELSRGCAVGPLGATISCHTDPLMSARLRATTSAVVSDALTGPIAPGCSARLTSALTAIFQEAAAPFEATTTRVTNRCDRDPGNARGNHFSRARDFIHAHLDHVTVTSLAHNLRLSRRSLEYAFQTAIGMSPQRYIAMCRLNAVRRDLQRTADSVGDAAARHGIWHLGRFASTYRTAFGEFPSQTKQRFADH